ncbi:MAG: Bax inhibitor-1 family protein [Planctomycetota bacterium]|nr:Bax inhibitor-1 family protein [Planctomycetota bacterium]
MYDRNPSVFKRTAESSSGNVISPGLYNFIIGIVLCWGFGVNYLMVKHIPVSTVDSVPRLLFYIGFFASCLFGVFLFKRSSSPYISFLGYNFVVVPFGFVVNLVVHQYDPDVVLAAVRVTAFVTAGMMVLGSLFPRFFQRIIRVLAIALIVVIIVEVIEIFIFGIHHGILDWIVAVIFCGYIGFDWARANAIPKTADNAVDSAAALYMDIINLFLRILRIMGGQRST